MKEADMVCLKLLMILEWLMVTMLFIQNPLMGHSQTSGADFLRIPKSAKALGLGETTGAVLDDLSGIEYNPASISFVRDISIAMMGQKWIGDSYGTYLAGVVRAGDLTFGGSFYNLDYGGFTGYDDWGNSVGQGTPNDLFTRFAASLDASVLSRDLKGLVFGGSAAFIYRNLMDSTSLGAILDIGAVYRFVVEQPYFRIRGMEQFPITTGFSIQNIGYSADSITPMKLTLAAGVVFITNFNISADVSVEYGRPFQFRLGLEYAVLGVLYLRTGFNLGKDLGNIALGAGLKISLGIGDIRVDYAFSPLDMLGNNHTLSVAIDFGARSPLKFPATNVGAPVKNTKSVIEILTLARRLYALGNLDDAIRVLEEGSRDYPSNGNLKEALVILRSANITALTNH